MAILSRRNFIATGLGCGAALAAAPGFGQTPTTGPSIGYFFDEFTAEWVRGNPNQATGARYFSGEEQDRLERQLTPETQAFKRGRIELAKKGLAGLGKFDHGSLSKTERISADLMEWQLNEVVREEPFLNYSFPLEQMNGANVGLVETMTVRHPLSTGRDAENYVAALSQVPARMQEAIEEARALEAKKHIPPRFILDATVKQMQGFIDPSPAQNPFVTSLDEKMSAIQGLPDSKRRELHAAAEKIVGGEVYPAWKAAIALLDEQKSKATDDAGIWRLKGGDEAYAYFLERFTTTKKTAAEIHQIGLDQVHALEGRMDALLRKLGRADGSVKDRIEKLKLDLQYPNPASEESRAQIMRDIDGILADAQKRAALLFDIRPKSPVIARAFPKFRENNAAANYNRPAPDGSRPGVFQYPRRLDKMTKFMLRSTVYHETVPGHHFQIALQIENKELPRFRQISAFGGISALTEGWGLYAERLTAESGWYEGDPEGLLGALDSQMFRARRLVVDTGLHAMKWTRQQGIDFGIEPSEVERYAVYPGQACSYMMGELKIVELREKARQALGDKFSLREYHNVVLKTGTVPLELLERQVDEYIGAGGGKA